MFHMLWRHSGSGLCHENRVGPISRVSLRVFKELLEGGYKFEKAGTYRFVFKVGKPNSLLAGNAMTRTVVVTE